MTDPASRRDILNKLEDMIQDGELVVFSRRDADALKDVADLSPNLREVATISRNEVKTLKIMAHQYEGIMAFTSMLGWVRNIIVIVGGIYLVLKGKESFKDLFDVLTK